ncbi:MAG: hypothetical protein JO023_10305 [Chloroflexi bacterium]|nr:hypothetical protein [Chloroflexota bacterium]
MASGERPGFFSQREHVVGLALLIVSVVAWLIWSIALGAYGINTGLDLMAAWVLAGPVTIGVSLTFGWIRRGGSDKPAVSGERSQMAPTSP